MYANYNEEHMSILNVEHLSHGFGDRAIFEDVSFRLLKGEHIGLIGANGEGKSTFMNIVTGKLMPRRGQDRMGEKRPGRIPGSARRAAEGHDHPRRAEIRLCLAF